MKIRISLGPWACTIKTITDSQCKDALVSWCICKMCLWLTIKKTLAHYKKCVFSVRNPQCFIVDKIVWNTLDIYLGYGPMHKTISVKIVMVKRLFV